MMKMRINKCFASLTVGLGLTMLAGCSQYNQLMGREEAVDYKSTVVVSDPLSIPPDLVQANKDPRYKAPEGTATYSQFAQDKQKAATVAPQDRVLPQTPGIQVMRDGDIRWLEVSQPAQVVYPKVVDFWGQQGFTIHSQDPQAGVMETDWAENRAKIPEDWIRSALGSILDSVYDSGERDRFRARLERVNGKTEIYISHDHMVETATADKNSWKWVAGKEDPGLNAVMLARLMVFLGTDVKTAQTKVEQAEKAPGTVQVVKADDGRAVLTLSEPFDRAWRRVGVAIDNADFSVNDRDRSAGDYYVRYLDTDSGAKIEQPNFLDRLFGGKGTAEAKVYRIHVAQQGSGTLVSVLDKNGQPDHSGTAKRIISVLSSHM